MRDAPFFAPLLTRQPPRYLPRWRHEVASASYVALLMLSPLFSPCLFSRHYAAV